jgi:hypothetical protein
VHGIFAESVEILVEVRIAVELVAGAGMLDDADLDSALFAEINGLLDGEVLAEVDVVVRGGKGRLGWGSGGSAMAGR